MILRYTNGLVFLICSYYDLYFDMDFDAELG